MACDQRMFQNYHHDIFGNEKDGFNLENAKRLTVHEFNELNRGNQMTVSRKRCCVTSIKLPIMNIGPDINIGILII